jgi:hypothetical protein
MVQTGKLTVAQLANTDSRDYWGDICVASPTATVYKNFKQRNRK